MSASLGPYVPPPKKISLAGRAASRGRRNKHATKARPGQGLSSCSETMIPPKGHARNQVPDILPGTWRFAAEGGKGARKSAFPRVVPPCPQTTEGKRPGNRRRRGFTASGRCRPGLSSDGDAVLTPRVALPVVACGRASVLRAGQTPPGARLRQVPSPTRPARDGRA